MRKVKLISVSGWNELTPKQLLIVAKNAAKQNYQASFKTNVFLDINGLRIKRGNFVEKDKHGRYRKYYVFQKNGYRKFLIERNVFVTMLEKFDWLEDDITLMRNYPKIAGRKACDHRLYGITLEQFIFADQLYAYFVETKQQKFLRQLNAVFYLDKKFDTSRVKKNARRFRFAKRAKLHSTFIWYTGVKKWMMNKYPYLFRGEGGEEMSPDESIMNMLSALNQGDITKNETLLKTHVHEALHQLNLMTEKATDHV
ncbi:MAG: hypothetical protein PF489_09770 [Salinivirgaceae bacterium]|jgi:hypothetical protein|nr:hypothetical protein [Salinivirgaceae bacterium]